MIWIIVQQHFVKPDTSSLKSFSTVAMASANKVASLSDCKALMSEDLSRVKAVQIKDTTVEALDLRGTLFQLWMHCSGPVRNEFNRTFDNGEDAVKSGLCLGILFYEHYIPNAEWNMDENTEQWDSAVLDVLKRFFQ